MALEECIKKSREAQPVSDDKFDRHIKKARENDLNSRKKMFVQQTEADIEKELKVNGLRPSVY